MYVHTIHTVIQKFSCAEIFVEEIFVLKYFRGLGLPKKFISTHIYTSYVATLRITLRKWRISYRHT